jgi:chromosomal replication initiator protein
VRIKEKFPAKRVLYVSAHLFLVQYTDSVRKNKFNDFINFYQSVEVLIIDDIQEISGESKQKTQQAFFHIFNHLQQTRHQLIMTSDRPPIQLEGMEERLLTRFKWGLVAELEKPDTKLAKKILLDKIHRNGLKFPREVVDYIAENATENIRDLEGVINAMLAYSVVYNSDIDLELAQRVVARTVKLEQKPITINEIVEHVSEYYDIPVKDICSKSRKQFIAQARQVSMYLAQKHTGLSYSRIGSVIGKRDHSTVLHSCNVIEHRISTDKVFRREMENIEASFR